MGESADPSTGVVTARREPSPVRAPHLYSIVVGLLVVGLLLRRLALSGLQSYGADGAQYIEHTARLRVLKMWQQLGDVGAWRFLFDADAAFPPMLHLLTLPSGLLVGYSAEAATAVSLIWLVLLAGVTGWIAQRLCQLEAVSAAAVVGIFLTPALHGYAVRYYYDVPVVALTWLAVALLVAGRDRWPLRCAVAVSLVFSAAVLTKWTALSFGPPLLLAGLVVRSRPHPLAGEAAAGGLLFNWRSRAVVGALVLIAVVVLLTVYLQMSGAENSLASMTKTAFGVGGASSAGAVSSAAVGVMLSDAVGAGSDRWAELSFAQRSFYPLRLVTSVFSPLLALLAVLLVLFWMAVSRLGFALLALPLLVYGGFLVLVMPVLDDRFLLPLVPAVVLACAFAWGELTGSWRVRVARIALACGLLVFFDFHFGSEGVFNQERLISHPHREDVPPTSARGLSAASSVELRGWCRADRQLPFAGPFREALWKQVQALEPSYLGVPGQKELIDPWGDLEWWRYRGLLDQVSGVRRGPEVIAICPPPGHPPYEPESPDVVVALVRSGSEPSPPSCLIRSQWQQVALVQDPESSKAASFWTRVERRAPASALPAGEPAQESRPTSLEDERPPGDLLPEDPTLP